MPQANVTLGYSTGGHAIKTIDVNKDGSYEIQIDDEGIFNLTFSGVNHSAVTLPILNDERKIIELNVNLPRYKYVDEFDDVDIVGDFNNFSFRTAKRMTKQDDGTYYAKFKTDQDTFAYQILKVEKSGHSINGTQADFFVYDGGGDYRSVVKVDNGNVKIIFDPKKIERDNSSI